jgi:hypothetical protein
MKGTLTCLADRVRRRPDDGGDALASLIMAAREDPGFRAKLVAVLKLPLAQRESLVATAIEEMRIRNESAAVRRAFARLCTEEGAKTALELLAPR